MSDERGTLEVGRIIKAHGLRGQVLVDLWSDRHERLAAGETLFSDRGPLVVLAAAIHQKTRFIVSFDRITVARGGRTLARRGAVGPAYR